MRRALSLDALQKWRKKRTGEATLEALRATHVLVVCVFNISAEDPRMDKKIVDGLLDKAEQHFP